MHLLEMIDDAAVATVALDPVRCRPLSELAVPASSVDRAACSSELTDAVHKLVARYHDAAAPAGRNHRLVIVAYPRPQEPPIEEPS